MNNQTDLSTYRLNAWNDFARYQQEKEFFGYVDRIYGDLLAMPPGQLLHIDKTVCPDNREKFIKICCLFIAEKHPDYEFSNDYKILKRYELEQPQRANNRLAQAKKGAKANSR